MINAQHFEDTYQIKGFEPKIFLFSYPPPMFITKNCDRRQPSKLWQCFFALLWFCSSAWLYFLCPICKRFPISKLEPCQAGKLFQHLAKLFSASFQNPPFSESSQIDMNSSPTHREQYNFFIHASSPTSPTSCQFRNLTTFVLKRVVILWSQIHLPNAHVSEESLTETFCDFLSWSTTPSRWKRRVHSFTPAFNLEIIQIHKYANKHKHRHKNTNTNTIQVLDAKTRIVINIYTKTWWMQDMFTISFGPGLWNKYKCTWQLVAIS